MKDSLLQLLQALLEVLVVLLTPYIIRTLKAVEAKALAVAGANNYSFAKDFIADIIKTRPDIFSEDELVNLVDDLDNKLGDKLTHEEIKQIVDVVIKDLAKEIKKDETVTEVK